MSTEKKSADPAPRTRLHVPVEFKKSYARKALSGVLKNISISGAFVSHAGRPLLHDEKLQLTFQVSGRQRKIHALVVWTNNLGSGVRFLPQNQQDIQIIDDLIYFVESRKTGTRDILDKILKRVA